MRLVPTSLALVSFSVFAGLAGCSSDPANSGAAGSSSVAGTSNSSAGKSNVGSAGSAGTGVVGSAGSGTGGSGLPAGGSGNTAGTNNGSAGSTPTAGTSSGGSGNPPGGGTTGAGGSGGSATVDPNAPDKKGKTNAKAGATTSANLDYLKLGEMRLINNNWGSVAWGCAGSKSTSSVFVSADKSSFGWKFDRGDCTTESTKPDFPEIEFGIHPFGLGSTEATSPDFSSTTLLPIQIKDLKTATVTTDISVQLDKSASWDLTFEFWLSKQNPATTQGNAGVYAELMTFWGNQANRWPLNNGGTATCDKGCDNNVAGGSASYNLIVQKNSWGSGWQYYQFRTANSSTSFNGNVDVRKLIDYLMKKDSAITGEMWVTRFEVGTEIDDDTKGTATVRSITFEVNGEKRSPVFGQ